MAGGAAAGARLSPLPARAHRLMATTIRTPPITQTEKGAIRRVGVEMEFSGLGIETIARVVRDTLGGEIDPLTPYEMLIRTGGGNDYRVELDYQYLKKMGRRERDTTSGLFELEQFSEDVLAAVAKRIVPFEIVTPPLPMDQLDKLDELTGNLRKAGALGSSHAAIYAFGLHLNPEMPALDADTIRRYLKSFLCLYDWLKERSQIDLSRRLTPHIQPFPRDYARHVIDGAYRPALAGLIDDYLEWNPTRNRALDLLPLFLELDRKRVRSVVEDTRVKGRPALHYRLPNCEIHQTGWGIHGAWNDWVAVERLAAAPEHLESLCHAYADHLDHPVGSLFTNWADEARDRLAGIGMLDES